MFIKKDLRKIPTILEDAIACSYKENDNDMDEDHANKENMTKRLKVQEPLSELRLGRRHQEFRGNVSILCTNPSYLCKLQRLQTLNLYDCGISTVEGLGVFLKECPSLTSLNLGRNPLQSLPEEFSLISTLKELWLDDCQLTGPFPHCLIPLPRLETLRVSNNRITSLQPLQNATMKTLLLLNLDQNPLDTDTIPQDWSGMKALKELYMRNCGMTRLPLQLPSSLVLCHFSSNPLKDCFTLTIYDRLWKNLPHLKVLSLNACQLTALPNGMIQHLVDHHSSSSSLEKVLLSHNPHLESLPEDVIHAIRAYEEFQIGPHILWQPNPQLEFLLH